MPVLTVLHPVGVNCLLFCFSILGWGERYAAQFSSTENIVDQPLNDYLKDKSGNLSYYDYYSRYVIGGEMALENSTTRVTAFFSGRTYHGSPIALQFVLNAMVKALTSGSKSIESWVFPLPKTEDAVGEKVEKKAQEVGAEIGGSIRLATAVVISMFIYHLVVERVVGAKHIQVSISGGAAHCAT